ncbi:hypothetical protein NE857_15105 [Nocardiopsis exhalans]|uniref:Uncharacterized protein n=1 Tax=Nocardiopsis exhalans TaxID=163604 RepID=A0ABY5DH40_9ACTN|nr:hypothetical protein [Nocardiopsis exhalans]USY22818.1 hypothetical protein NE857_15105 [Nocardiopsis exhalans]
MSTSAPLAGAVLPRRRSAVVFSLLLSAAGLMMLWTWTGGTVFVAAAGVLVAAVVLFCLSGRHRDAFEVIGGPLDGARLPLATVEAGTEILLLRTTDGGGARYTVASSRSLVYRGQAGTSG